MKYDEMTINQIRVFLTNGESMVMYVGEINFYKREDSPLDFKSSGGSNDNSGFGTLSVEENMNIESYEVSFINSLKNNIIYDLISVKKSLMINIVSLFQRKKEILYPINIIGNLKM